MSKSKYETLKHIENVRNYLNAVIYLIMGRGESHDQSKLESPEAEIFEEFTCKLKDCTYGTPEYYEYLDQMKVGIHHHYKVNRHHPEHHKDGIDGMNLIDLIEMLVDWKAASLRHDDGDIWKSIEMNQKRFGYSDEMKNLLIRTMKYIEPQDYINANQP